MSQLNKKLVSAVLGGILMIGSLSWGAASSWEEESYGNRPYSFVQMAGGRSPSLPLSNPLLEESYESPYSSVGVRMAGGRPPSPPFPLDKMRDLIREVRREPKPFSLGEKVLATQREPWRESEISDSMIWKNWEVSDRKGKARYDELIRAADQLLSFKSQKAGSARDREESEKSKELITDHPNFSALPPELFYEIFSLLNIPQLLTASRVCKAWLSAASDSHLCDELWNKSGKKEEYLEEYLKKYVRQTHQYSFFGLTPWSTILQRGFEEKCSRDFPEYYLPRSLIRKRLLPVLLTPLSSLDLRLCYKDSSEPIISTPSLEMVVKEEKDSSLTLERLNVQPES